MDAPFRLREVGIDEIGPGFERITANHLEIRVSNLLPDTILPFDILFPSYGGGPKELRLEKLLSEGQVFRRSLSERLEREQIESVYIREENEAALLDYLTRNVQDLVRSSNVSVERKTRLLYDNAEIIVKKVFRERPSRSNIIVGQQFVDAFADYVSTDELSTGVLLSLFSKDYYTFTHSVQTTLMGMSFCRFLGWEGSEIKSFGLGALFHDVGKNAIDERILNKPTRLDKEEFEIIQKHPVLGYQQLKNARTLTREQLIVPLHHHEAMDGSGYPGKLKGPSIHKYARVARLVDVFDALSTRRVYKEALSISETLRIMTEEMGRTFDPGLLKRFVEFVQTGGDAAESIVEQSPVNIEVGSHQLLHANVLVRASIRGGIYIGRAVGLSMTGCRMVLSTTPGEVMRDFPGAPATLSMRLPEEGLLRDLACKVKDVDVFNDRVVLEIELMDLSDTQTKTLSRFLENEPQ